MISINCDMGEGFGLYKFGNDEGIMPFITDANIACGFHGSDPNHMNRAVQLAKQHGVNVGAHFSLPDLSGFGRREMKVEPKELTYIILYQIGALSAFLKFHGLTLSHLKPHGALYSMSAKDAAIANVIADIASHYQVPVMGMSGTQHEKVYTQKGVTLIPEFFVDLDYDDSGQLIVTREHGPVSPATAVEKGLRAVHQGEVLTLSGTCLPVNVNTICIHSDTPNAIEIARALHQALRSTP